MTDLIAYDDMLSIYLEDTLFAGDFKTFNELLIPIFSSHIDTEGLVLAHISLELLLIFSDQS